MPEQIWKAVAGYEGLYEVSDHGSVRSLDRQIQVLNRWGSVVTRQLRGRVLRLQTFPNGYKSVLFSHGDKRHLVHRLVAAAFLACTGGAEQVNHKDGDRANNKQGNLEWVTCSENHTHAHTLPWRRLNCRAIRLAAATSVGPCVFESLKAFVRYLKETEGKTRTAGSVYSAIFRRHLVAGIPVWEA